MYSGMKCRALLSRGGRVKACIILYPVLSQNKVGFDLLKKCNPEMIDQEFPVVGLPVYGVITDSDRHSDQQRSLFRSAGVETGTGP